MKIQATERPRLNLGTHRVSVEAVEHVAASEYQGVPYLNVRLENEEGYLEQRFYLSEAGQPILAGFIQALGLDPEQEHDTQDFVGKSLVLDVEEHTYTAPDNQQERTIKQGVHFRSEALSGAARTPVASS